MIDSSPSPAEHSWIALRGSQVGALLLLVLVFVLASVPPLWHTDVWAHLKYGEWIAVHRQLPAHEPFCPFADSAAKWSPYCWLTQVGLYLAFHAGELIAGGSALTRTEGGVEALKATHALLVVGRFALLLVAFKRRSGSLGIASACLAVLVLLSLGSIALLRPQVVGELLFSGLLLLLSGPAERSLLLAPGLVALWANAHGSYPLGFALLGAALVAACIEKDRAAARRAAIALALSVAAVAVFNPSGPRIFLETVELARNPNMATTREWSPLAFSLSWGWHVHYLVSVALLAAVLGVSPRRPSALEALLLLLGVAPLVQQRWLVWWFLVVPWIAARHVSLIVAARGGVRQGEANLRKTVIAATVVFAGLLLTGPARWLASGHPESLERSVFAGTPWREALAIVSPREAPGEVAALGSEIAGRYPGGRFVGTVFTSEMSGDYLLWALPAAYPVTAYSHVHAFSPTYWQAWRAAKQCRPGWREFLEATGSNLVVIEGALYPELRAALSRDPAWVVVRDLSDDPGLDVRARLFVALRRSAPSKSPK